MDTAIRLGGYHADPATVQQRFNTVEGCVIQGAQVVGWAHGSRVRDSELSHTRIDGIFLQNTSYAEIANTSVHHVNERFGDTTTTDATCPNPKAECWSGGDAIQFSNVSAWHVHGNHLDRSNSGNKFCFIANFENGLAPADLFGLYERNLCRVPDQLGFQRDGVTASYGSGIYFGVNQTGYIVRHSQFLGPSEGTGIYHHTTGLQLYGNVFARLGTGLVSLGGDTYAANNVWHDLSGPLTKGAKVHLANCILDNRAATSSLGGVVEAVSNLYWKPPAPTGNLAGDPLFVDGPGGDFHLQPGSPAVDQGTRPAWLPADYVADVEGTPLAAGAGIDIGVFQQ